MISLHWWSYFTPRSPEYDVRQEEIETTFLAMSSLLAALQELQV